MQTWNIPLSVADLTVEAVSDLKNLGVMPSWLRVYRNATEWENGGPLGSTHQWGPLVFAPNDSSRPSCFYEDPFPSGNRYLEIAKAADGSWAKFPVTPVPWVPPPPKPGTIPNPLEVWIQPGAPYEEHPGAMYELLGKSAQLMYNERGNEFGFIPVLGWTAALKPFPVQGSGPSLANFTGTGFTQFPLGVELFNDTTGQRATWPRDKLGLRFDPQTGVPQIFKIEDFMRTPKPAVISVPSTHVFRISDAELGNFARTAVRITTDDGVLGGMLRASALE